MTDSPSAPEATGDFENKHLIALGRKLFRGEIDFVKGCVALDGLPDADRPEVAFAGRSNVGKSSLINALTGRNSLARTSNTPGRTQELNYFKAGDALDIPLYLVDLPGYGYAKIERRKVEAWTELVKDYLRGRASLRRILLLIDGRHGIKPNDLEIAKMLDKAAVNYQIILTKMDKLRKEDQEIMLTKTRDLVLKRVACHPVVLASSAEKGWGIEGIRAEIAGIGSR